MFNTKEFKESPIVTIKNWDHYFSPVPNLTQEQQIRIRKAKVVLNDYWMTDLIG